MASTAAQATITDPDDGTPARVERDARTLALFEDRYGAGAHARVTELLGQPCVTFAEIAAQFGVTRERVRQWRVRFLPDAPTGHERQRLCARYQRRRRLFQDELFRAFFRHARAHLGPGHIEPIRSRDGYHLRSARIHHRLVALRESVHADRSRPAVRYRGQAEFVFVRLPNDEFWFFPTGADWPTSRFRNSFTALSLPPGAGEPAAAVPASV